MNETPKETPTLGVALGSGAARGLAHIGVLKVFEEENIQIDTLAGTSIGALIGALFAAGVPVRQMEQVALEIDWRSMAKLLDPVIPLSGLTDGRKLVSFIEDLLPVRNFEDLNRPFAITATDIKTGEAVIIKQGDLLEALRASLAFPGIFSPASFGKRLLVDGGLCNPLPIDVTRNMGADKVIGICTIPKVNKKTPEAYMNKRNNHRETRGWKDYFNARRIEQAFKTAVGKEFNGDSNNGTDIKPPNIFKVCAQSVAIMENVINDLQIKQCPQDLILRPELDDITLLEFHRADEIIAAGEAAAHAAMSEIDYLLGSA